MGRASPDPSDPDEASLPRCDFCRLPRPPTPVTDRVHGEVYEFCSVSCRDALEASEQETAVFQGFKRYEPGVPVLERHFPDGILRNSMTLVSSAPGARGDALMVELVWYALQQGRTAVIVAYREPPVSVLEAFLDHDWNVFPYLEHGQLHLIDCFTYRVEEADRMVDRLDRWTEHVHRVASSATRPVRDPTDLGSVLNTLDECIEVEDVRQSGIAVLDSLTEVGTLVAPVQAYDFVKDLRADIAKGRFVPVFAHAAYREDADEFPHDLAYMMDGIIDLRFNDELVAGHSIKQFRVRKMRGVPTASDWVSYYYHRDHGLTRYDPGGAIEPGGATGGQPEDPGGR